MMANRSGEHRQRVRTSRGSRSRGRVVFVCQDGFDLAPARVRCYRFAEVLGRMGFDCRVVSFFDHLGAPKQGAETEEISDRLKLELNLRAHELLRRERDAIFYVQKAGYHSLAPFLAAAENGNPVVLDYDDYDVNFHPYGALREILPDLGGGQWLENLASRASLCVAASRELHGLVSRFNARTLYLPTGVDLWRFDGGPLRRQKQGDELVRLLWLGDVWGPFMVENVLFALDAFFDTPPEVRSRARFSVVAYGRAAEELRERARERFGQTPELVFPERLHPDAVPEAMAQHDIGVFPLYRDVPWTRAKSPTKLFEYMAMRMAIAASPTGEAGRVLENGVDGLTVANRGEFTEALARLVADSELRVRLGENAHRKVVTRYSLGRLLRSLAGHLDELARGRGPIAGKDRAPRPRPVEAGPLRARAL